MIEVEFTLVVRDTIQGTELDRRAATFPLLETTTTDILPTLPPEVVINTVRQVVDSMRQEIATFNPSATAMLDEFMERFTRRVMTA